MIYLNSHQTCLPSIHPFSQFFESIGLGLENFGLKKSLSNDLKKFVLENFGLQKLWTW